MHKCRACNSAWWLAGRKTVQGQRQDAWLKHRKKGLTRSCHTVCTESCATRSRGCQVLGLVPKATTGACHRIVLHAGRIPALSSCSVSLRQSCAPQLPVEVCMHHVVQHVLIETMPLTESSAWHRKRAGPAAKDVVSGQLAVSTPLLRLETCQSSIPDQAGAVGSNQKRSARHKARLTYSMKCGYQLTPARVFDTTKVSGHPLCGSRASGAQDNAGL